MTTALQILQHTFGYHAFRGQQDAIIETIVAGQDALVLMPTGGGKSLCYQIPALVRNGAGIVISPLIALMQDQVDALRALGIRAGFLNSTLSFDAANQLAQQLRQGEINLLYVAPERLTQPRTLALLRESPLALFAIDEAHCVAQWGHDFRSDYLQLGLLQEHFPEVPRIALTATADPRTRQEIAQRLGLEQARQFVSSFDRPNIQYRIEPKKGARKQLLYLLKTEHADDAGIVYCLSRKKVDQTAAWLNQQGITALPYHAGLSANVRQQHQQRFLRDDGIVMVATVAFGMGIDKPDVRFVAHLDMPKSLEGYYQETGRAGRDGQPATAWMAYGLQDALRHKQMLAQSDADEQFKRNRHRQLESILALCETTHCRRQMLLDYFGESLPNACGNCDTCLNPPDVFDATEAAQKALSCVYRTGQRYGVTHLVDVLTGHATDKLQRAGHDQISTWNIGSEYNATQWRTIYRQLIARGLLLVDVDGYGGLRLSDTCRSVLRGEQTLELRRDTLVKKAPQRQAKRQPLPIEVADEPLWDALRECRTRLSKEAGVPPYVVFHDATLVDMVHQRPRNLNDMAGISGVGDKKLSAYGETFLALIAEFA